MGKVIEMVTKKEITEMPATVEQGEALIETLLKFELANARRGTSNQELISNVISMVENNSGARRFDVMDRIYKKQRKV